MKRPAASALLLFLAVATASAVEPPSLIVVVVVDQMRADYLNRPWAQGMKTLLEGGAVFTNARHTHVPTLTAPGHATIATGRLPYSHGIVGNAWWDEKENRSVLPSRDETDAVSPVRLAAPTLGDLLKEMNPRSRVAAVAGKERSAVMMGGRRSDLTTWHKGDEATVQAALDAMKNLGLGKDGNPDILWVSLSDTDHVGHAHGPGGEEMARQLARLDTALARLIQGADAAAGRGRWGMALSSDHGVMPMPESPEGVAAGARRVSSDAVAREVEAALQTWKPLQGTAWVRHTALPHIYLHAEAVRRLTSGDWNALVKAAATGPLVAAAYAPGRADTSADPYDSAHKVSVFAGRSGDILVRLEAGLVNAGPGQTSHGTVYEDDAAVPVLFWGEPFKAGRFTKPAGVASVAETIAAVLGTHVPQSDGRVLTEALRAPEGRKSR